jgi:hypothetical protein
MRSRFFQVFTILTLFVLSVWSIGILLAGDSEGWSAKSIPSNIPLMNLLILNVGQAITTIFLASDFLKRDRKLDTSEVFYVRPLGNAEYILGKIWGNLRVFLLLNIVVMGLSVLFTLFVAGVSVDWAVYPVYFFLISVPTLVYIAGLSVLLMLVLKNQAITFILLLGYIGLTLFYISDTFYYLFDYMACYIPLVKSTITGFINMNVILIHRAIYGFAGLGCIFLVIPLFGRLPDTPRSNYVWVSLSIAMFLLCGLAGYKYVSRIKEQKILRTSYVATSKRYEHASKLKIERYNIRLEQAPRSFAAEAQLQGISLATDSVFPLCLNPGLEVEDVRQENKPLVFTRDNQMLLIHFGRKIIEGDTLSFDITYGGVLEPAFCYLDIPDEMMEEENRILLFNPDKQYVFQTPDYLLFTPESYWYPRPVAEYFSHFTLNVLPLPGLTPLSQGEGISHAGAYSFAPEYPLRAISLAVGKYRQTSVVSDSVMYNLWTLEGNSLYSSFDAIQDTIPSLIRKFREDTERKFRMSYPFKRFSVIETPLQFTSYPRIGSQAQEMMQPEMVFFPERGWRYAAFEIEKAVKRKVNQAQRNGQSMNKEEAQISVFNDLLRNLSDPVSDYDYVSSGRGTWRVVAKTNPYFIYPQLYNFRYNVFSPDWTVANPLIESYLQSPGVQSSNDREREVNGISQQERAALLMEKQSLSDLLADISHRDLMNALISLKADRLFAPAEVRIGRSAFRDSLYAVLERHAFHNMAFEDLLIQLSERSGTDLLSRTEEWKSPTPLPLYHIRQPEVTQYTNRGQETFVMKITLSNDSDQDGFVQLSIQDENRSEQTNDEARKIELPAHRGKQLVSVWEHAPRTVTFYTGLSGNLPNVIRYTVSNIKQERGTPADKEGDYMLPVPDTSPAAPDEVIVDNEDTGLFELSEAPIVGLLPKYLDRMEDTTFSYTGVTWRLPFRWTATTHANYYGRYIHSAYVVRNGSGNQTATWKVPVPSPGYYDVYYYMSDVYGQGNNNRRQAEYRFRILYDGETEDTYLNLNTAGDGWASIGAYYFTSDTIRIILTNECEWRRVSADAVRIVKRM